MSFSALESRINASVLKHLANAQATLGGVAVQGIFKRAYVESGAGMGMASTAPTFRLASIDVPASPVGLPLVIDGVNYAIAAPEPDGTGMTLLILERTA